MAKTSGALLRLQQWVTVDDAARHVSDAFSERVTRTDILRLALAGELKLSVYLVNHAHARVGKWVYGELDHIIDALPDEHLNSQSKAALKKFFSKPTYELEKNIVVINGVWDLSMLGAEKLDIEHEYQMLTGGPEVTLVAIDGVFLERPGGVMCQIQESFDNNEFQQGSIAQLAIIDAKIASENLDKDKARELLEKHAKDREEYLRKKSEKDRSEDWFPAGGLPKDAVLVVKTEALLQFIEKASSQTHELDRPISGSIKSETDTEKWLLKIMKDSKPSASKESYFATAQAKFQVSRRGFDRAWGNATKAAGGAEWTKPGRKS